MLTSASCTAKNTESPTTATASSAKTAEAENTAKTSSDNSNNSSDSGNESVFTERDLAQTADLTNAKKYTVKDNKNIKITSEGVYVLSGEAKDVTVTVDAGNEAKVQLVLNGVSIKNTSAPAIYVKSADIVKTDAPEDAADKHTDPENSQGIRYFVPVTGSDFEYVVTMNTRAYNLPDIESTGNTIDLKAGERVIVAAISGEWYKIVYMNAEYYVLSYLEPRDTWVESNPDEEIVDNTGYAPAGSPEAADAASSAGGDATPATEEPAADTSSSGDSSDSYESYSGAPSYGQELLNLTNEARTAAGLAPLTWSSALGDCADIRAKELPLLTEDQNRNHERPDGSAWYTVNDGIMYAENIAYGQTSAQEVFNAWMNSPGHRDNIMNPGYRTFGAALYYTDGGYYYYWVQEFGY